MIYMPCYARDVIAIAIGELGYHEKASNANLDDKTKNSGDKNYTKYARDLDAIAGFYNSNHKQGNAYCAMTVDWCFVKAFGVNKALELLCQPWKSAGAGCLYSYRYYKNKAQVGKEPKIGAQVFFAKGTEETIHHTGIVIGFDKSYVYTIEGNTSNGVYSRRYSRSKSTIYGYGYPKFDKDPKGDPNYMMISATEVKLISGSDTKKAASVGGIDNIPFGNLNSLNKEPKAIGRVTAAVLNVRKLPGAENETLTSVPAVKKDCELEICDKLKAANGKPWLYVRINKKTYGFVSATYVDLISNDVSDDSDKYSTR